jgi:hypothetical protein
VEALHFLLEYIVVLQNVSFYRRSLWFLTRILSSQLLIFSTAKNRVTRKIPPRLEFLTANKPFCAETLKTKNQWRGATKAVIGKGDNLAYFAGCPYDL